MASKAGLLLTEVSIAMTIFKLIYVRPSHWVYTKLTKTYAILTFSSFLSYTRVKIIHIVDNVEVVLALLYCYFWSVDQKTFTNQKTNVMKNNWKKVSTALLILAASASLQAASPTTGKNPGEKDVLASTPALQVKGNRIFVNHLNLEGESVILKVYDEENRLLYFRKFDETPVVEKAFNFEKAYEGTYSVVLKDGDVTYTATLAVTL